MTYNNLLNHSIQLYIAGSPYIVGSLIDVGTDTIVIENKNRYIYIPTTHIHSIKKIPSYYNTDNSSVQDQSFFSSTYLLPPVTIQKDESSTKLSFKKILENSMTTYVELKIEPKEVLTGKILSVQTDYCLFWNIITQTQLIIPFSHIKWLSPLHELAIADGLKVDTLETSVKTKVNLPPTLYEYLQLANKKHIDFYHSKSGFISSVTTDFLEVTNIYGESTFIPLPHIKYFKYIY